MSSDAVSTPYGEHLAAFPMAPSRRSMVTERLRAAVLAGEMESGRVYSAPALAEGFGVSSTPVREAMLDLVKEGLVEVVRNKGFRVVAPSKKVYEEVMDLRILLEPYLIAIAARNGLTASRRAELDALADDTVATIDPNNPGVHVAADHRFHIELLAGSENTEGVEIVRVLRSKSRLAGLNELRSQEFLLKSARQHHDLVEAVAGKNPQGAADLMSRHLQEARTAWAPAEV